MTPTRLLLYCRPGFEKECAAEIQDRASELGIAGYPRAAPQTAYVEFIPFEPTEAESLAAQLDFSSLIFPRQLIVAGDPLMEMPIDDRVGPLLDALGDQPVSEVLLETPDTNAGKELLALCRKLTPPLLEALKQRDLLVPNDPKLPRLHGLLLSATEAFIGLSRRRSSSPWLMGIPRLRSPSSAPSRSTLKLEEALLTFFDERERERHLQPGMRAVDLGAAPGGWTWQLVRRSIHVTAVDNGPMAPALLESGLVEHRREDGFRFRPKKPVDWMVCDMVEQPGRIARLAALWLAKGQCRETIFNLKLPMKQRYQEVQRCAGIIGEVLDQAGIAYGLRFKQLYHDREEVTGHLQRLD